MSQPAVRDLRLVSERTRSDLLDTAHQAWSTWAAECLPAATSWSPTFEVQGVDEAGLVLASGDWQAHGAQSLAGWSQWSERGRQQLAARLVQRHASAAPLPEGDWALAAADRAWSLLTEQLLGPVLPAPDASEASPDTRPWSGVVFISEPVLEARWAWRLPARVPSAQPAAATGRSILDCVGHRSLRLQAELGEVDITLADLLALQAGDVVRFPASTGQGVPFTLGQGDQNAGPATGRVAGRAQLGQIDGHLALRLSPSSSVRS